MERLGVSEKSQSASLNWLQGWRDWESVRNLKVTELAARVERLGVSEKSQSKSLNRLQGWRDWESVRNLRVSH